MATSLYIITNSKLTGNETESDWKSIVKKLNDLNFGTISIVNAEGQIIKKNGNWDFEVEKDEDTPFNVDFFGPFHIQPCLYKNIGIIYTIYKYRLLYEIYEYDWFSKFRLELFKIISIIGGTEVIYLADNGCNKLSAYLELMACDNIPYEVIKEKMINELGNPITDYSKLEYAKLKYSNITEFFLDDFKDLTNT